MNRFLLFLKKIIFVLLFLVIEAVALNYYANSSSYNRAKLVNASNFLAGDIYRGLANIRQYFHLGSENKRLMAEIAGLREKLDRFSAAAAVGEMHVYTESLYRYIPARVVNNSITRGENFIMLDKGARDGVVPDMAVISDGAIVGYVLHVSDKYSVAISILNTKFRSNGKIKGESHSGTIYWDGERYDEINIFEIPKYAVMNVGDTIVTTESSLIFPPDMLIGTIREFELMNGTYYHARIKLFNDMGALHNVILVEYEDLKERVELEERVR